MTPESECPGKNTADMMSSPTENVPPLRKKKFQKWEVNIIMKDQKILIPIILVVIKRLKIPKTRNNFLPLKMIIV